MYIEGAIIKIERTKQPNKSSTQPTERERGPVKAKRGTEKPEPRDYITKLREADRMKKTEMIKKAAEAKSRCTGVPAESYERIFKTMTKANLELQLYTYTTLRTR